MTRLVACRARGRAAILFFGLPSIARLYTGLALVRGGRLHRASSRRRSARASRSRTALVVTAAWLFLNLRIALSAAPVLGAGHLDGQQGVRIELPGRAQLRAWRSARRCSSACRPPSGRRHEWMTWLAFRHAVPFGVPDPVLGTRRRVLRLHAARPRRRCAARSRRSSSSPRSGAASIYALAGSLGLAPTGGLVVGRPAKRHLALLAAAFFLVLAFGAWLDIPRMLTSSSGLVHGASYADVAVRFPAARLLVGVSIVGALLAVLASGGPTRWLAARRRPLPRWCRSAARRGPRPCSGSSSRRTSRCARRRT